MSNEFSELEEKAVRRSVIGAARKATRGAVGAGRRANKLRSTDRGRPEYDGDNDGFITNPLTGRDEIPWKRGSETPEQAINRFFGGKPPKGIGKPIAQPKKSPAAAKRRAVGAAAEKPKPTTPKPITTGRVAKTPDMVNQIAEATRRARWPKDADGRLKPTAALTDNEIERALLAWEAVDSDNPSIAQAVTQIREEARARGILRTPREQRMSAPDRRPMVLQREAGAPTYRPWSPGPLWKGRRDSRFTWMEDAKAEERLSTDAVNLEIVDARQHQFDEDGYIVIGSVYNPANDEWIEWDPNETQHVHSTIEDAMKYAEDLDKMISANFNDDFDIFDPSVNYPEPNQISGDIMSAGPDWSGPNRPVRGKRRLLGDPIRTHQFEAPALEQAREVYRSKWGGRNRNADLLPKIEYAEDRLSELRMLYEQMHESFQGEFAGMDEAWNMSVDDFAQWAVSRGLVDTLADGRLYHAELMDAWDQLSSDQDEVSLMMSEISDQLDKYIDTWNLKNDQGVPSFEVSWEDYARDRR